VGLRHEAVEFVPGVPLDFGSGKKARKVCVCASAEQRAGRRVEKVRKPYAPTEFIDLIPIVR